MHCKEENAWIRLSQCTKQRWWKRCTCFFEDQQRGGRLAGIPVLGCIELLRCPVNEHTAFRAPDDGSADGAYRPCSGAAHLCRTVAQRLFERCQKLIQRLGQQVPILGEQCEGPDAAAGLQTPSRREQHNNREPLWILYFFFFSLLRMKWLGTNSKIINLEHKEALLCRSSGANLEAPIRRFLGVENGPDESLQFIEFHFCQKNRIQVMDSGIDNTLVNKI